MSNVRRIALASVALVTLIPAAGAWAQAAEVSAPAGQITGTEEEGLRIFQGIPYAEAPVGDLRWASPQPRASFTETFAATDPGADCVQSATFWRPGDTASTEEDCLSLTVYVPAEGGENLPVMVGYHGGGSINGAKTDWDPRDLARRGNVVVTVNYRLGAMGYLNLPELDAEAEDSQSGGNYGHLDKVEALRWVEKNISAFGGNPDQVTVAGQSAGASGVCFIVASPEAEGLVDGAIIESTAGCAVDTKESAMAGFEDFVAVAGCGDAEDRLACLRALTPAQILDAQLDSRFAARTVIGGGGLPMDTAEAFASGAFNRVPIIYGNTRNERRAATYEGNDLIRQPVSMDAYEEQIRTTYEGNADAILAQYAPTAEQSPGQAMADVASDARVCTTNGAIESLSQWVPIHVYEFRDETAPARPYMVVPPSYSIGSGHSAELPYVWGSLIVGELSAEQQKLADLMQGYWEALAAPESLAGTDLPDWPAYTTENPQRLLLLEGGETEVVSDEAFFAEHNCSLFIEASN